MSTKHVLALAALAALGVLVVDAVASNYGYNFRTYLPAPSAPAPAGS